MVIFVVCTSCCRRAFHFLARAESSPCTCWNDPSFPAQLSNLELCIYNREKCYTCPYAPGAFWHLHRLARHLGIHLQNSVQHAQTRRLAVFVLHCTDPWSELTPTKQRSHTSYLLQADITYVSTLFPTSQDSRYLAGSWLEKFLLWEFDGSYGPGCVVEVHILTQRSKNKTVVA